MIVIAARDALIKYYKLGGLTKQTPILSQLFRLKLKDEVVSYILKCCFCPYILFSFPSYLSTT
jgi:hypothetical protein